MSLIPGTRIGPYEITAPIGAGGMGQVYRAHDSRLGRDVAIKVSSERFSERLLLKLPEGFAGFDATADGQRFLTAAPAGNNTPTPFTAVLNWQTGLKN